MPGLPFATFSGSRRGLFSPEEVRRLMEVEFSRARRYRYPLGCLMIAIDRLQELAHLYGEDSRHEILDQVVGLMRGATRSSDFLGYLLDERLLAVFPHTETGGCAAVARRLVHGARRLAFDGGGSSVSVTLSIGISELELDREQSFGDLVDQSARALERAREAGGNRFMTYTHEASPVAAGPISKAAAESASEVASRAAQAAVAGAREDMAAMLDRMLHEKVQAIFESQGQKLPDFGGREKEVLQLAVAKMEEEHRRQVDMLQRRLAKVSDALGMTEAELRRAIASKNVDQGIASIYSTFQGLADDESNGELKREMMTKIFEANVELRKQLKQ